MTDVERHQVLAVLRETRFVDKSPAHAWAVLLDEGIYLCSISTMYRILRANNEIRERRRRASHPPRARPELVATGPNQVFSWDITKLKGPHKGLYYDLMVMLDIFSRKVIHQKLVPESAVAAQVFMREAFAANNGIVPTHMHSANGPSMTSKNVAQLLVDLQITRSLSHPHVSNDNPYSEAGFKTLKYCPAFPERFASIAEAKWVLRQVLSLLQHPTPPQRYRPAHTGGIDRSDDYVRLSVRHGCSGACSARASGNIAKCIWIVSSNWHGDHR
ncbi:transposase [Nocardia sp. NBC_01388]|uniref:transposase n=1 Tax=Nocardia sp. NBC_01388 TaxID=2903596 RepID=UPI00324E21CD